MADGRQMSRNLSSGSMDGGKGAPSVQNISVNGGVIAGISQRATAYPKFPYQMPQTQASTRLLTPASSQVPWRGDGQPPSGQQVQMQQQQQHLQGVTVPFCSSKAGTGGDGSGGGLMSSESTNVVPTQVQIERVLKVMHLISKTEASSESKNEQVN